MQGSYVGFGTSMWLQVPACQHGARDAAGQGMCNSTPHKQPLLLKLLLKEFPTCASQDGRYKAFLADVAAVLPADRIVRDPLRLLAYGGDASFYRLMPKAVLKVGIHCSVLLAPLSAASAAARPTLRLHESAALWRTLRGQRAER